MPSDSRTARPRAVFLDYDGTAAHHGVIPAANVEAIQRARGRGHLMVLATGRPACLVAPEVAELFDALVTGAGAHIRIGAEVLRDLRYPEELAQRTLDVLEGAGAGIVLEAAETIYCPPAVAQEFTRAIEPAKAVPAPPPAARSEGRAGAAAGAPGSLTRGSGSRGITGEEVLAAVRVRTDLRGIPFAKALVRSSDVPLVELAERIGPEVRALPSSIQGDRAATGELQLADVDKADGLRLLAERFGIPLADTVAVGDGANDVGMLRTAGAAIGIEGARREVVAVSDFLVPGPRSGGLAEAFDRLGLS